MSSGLPGAAYQVFLSFRGPDTRQGFTDCLFHFLVDAGVRVFRDNEEIRPGEKIDVILRAMDISVVGIPIFSKDYASSKWCLRELAEMVEKKKKIMPVFYDVTPDDVKLKTGLYREALAKHENENEKKQWEKALEEVAEISGWDSSLQNKEEEALKEVVKIKGWELKDTGHAELCKCIVKEVLENLKVKDRILTDHLVGMRERVDIMENYLDVNSPGVRYIGIYGIGGTGKTTLAKTLFNKLSGSFEASSFLADVRESSKQGGLVSLQKKLIGDIKGKSSTNIDDTDDGIKTLRDICRSKRILIVLDDVDSREQIESLAGVSSWFFSGSRIIVTTRNKNVLLTQEALKDSRILQTYEMREIDIQQALQLFSRHAFGTEYPPIEYLDISREIVNAVGRLPLSLVIIGSYLQGKHKEAWEENRNTLLRIPQKNIQKTLKLSYDSLDFRTQQIFLDIACFPVYLDKRNAFYMWESCDFRPELGIEELISLSLVKIVDGEKFDMHDHLKELGREIVRMEGFFDFGERSRLWSHKAAWRILKGKQGTTRTQVLQLSSHEVPLHGSVISQESFQNLRSLRFLGWNGANLFGDFEHKLSNLRWLCWNSCPGDFEARNLNMENLVILDLSLGKMPNGWEGWNQMKIGEGLKVLELSFCKIDRTPNFSKFGNLERLNLEGSTIREIDPSIGKLKRLKHFNLKRCQSLQGLPEEIGSMRALEELFLHEDPGNWGGSSKITSLPETIGNLSSLVILEVVNYRDIAVLPDSIGRLGRLQRLSLEGSSITQLPHTLGGLRKIKYLSLRKCDKIEQLPESFGNLNSLSELDISDSSLIEFPHSIGDVEELKVINMSSCKVRTLPSSIGKLKNLEELNAEESYLNGEIPTELGMLPRLKKLVLSRTSITRLPNSISQLPSLHTLWLVKCNKLEEVVALPSSLVRFNFNSSVMTRIPDLSSLNNLAVLQLNNKGELDWFEFMLFLQLMLGPGEQKRDVSFSLPPQKSGKHLEFCISKLTAIPSEILGYFSQLVSLELGCPDLLLLPQLPSTLSVLTLRYINSTGTKLTSLSNLKKLSELTLYSCFIEKDGFSSLAIGELRELVRLSIINFAGPQFNGLSLPSSLPFLTFDTGYANKLPENQFDGLSLPSCLQFLTFHTGLANTLPDLSRLKNLRSLAIKDYEVLSHVPGMGQLKSLEELNIDCCRSLRLFGIRLPKSLKRLQIVSCPDKVLNMLHLDSLELLILKDCGEIVTIRGLGGLESLQDLTISCCRSFKSLGLQLPENLKSLDLSHCLSLKLPDLSCLRNLLNLKISNCDAIVKIKGLEEMVSLQRLEITECDSLRAIRSQLPASLKMLEIRSCSSLMRFPEVSHLKNMQLLIVDYGDRGLEIPGIEELTWLRRKDEWFHKRRLYMAM